MHSPACGWSEGYDDDTQISVQYIVGDGPRSPILALPEQVIETVTKSSMNPMAPVYVPTPNYINPPLNPCAQEFTPLSTLTIRSRDLPPGFSNYRPGNMTNNIVPIPRPLLSHPPLPIKRTRIYLLGHSFITRVMDAVELKSHKFKKVTLKLWGSKWASLGIDAELVGRRGAKFPYLENFTNDIKEEKPDGLVIEIGSNDLCHSSINPQGLARDVVNYAQWWIENKATVLYGPPLKK